MRPAIKYGLSYTAMFIIIAAIALWLTWPVDTGLTPPSGTVPPAIIGAANEESAWDGVIFFFAMLLIVTVLVLIAIKLKVAWIYAAFMMFSCFSLMAIGIFTILTSAFSMPILEPVWVMVAIVVSGILVAVAFLKKSIRVMNLIGVIVLAWASGALGISFTPKFILVILGIFATYDFIAVYITKHMITMAGGILSTGVPVGIMVFGTNPGEKVVLNINQPREERTWMILGWGDLVVPTIFAVSANFYLPHTFLGMSPIAIGGMIGAIVGYFGLGFIAEKFPTKGHAGLPPIVGGIIAGVIVSSLMMAYPNPSLWLIVVSAAVFMGASLLEGRKAMYRQPPTNGGKS